MVSRRLFLAALPGAAVLGRPSGAALTAVEPTPVTALARMARGPFLTVNEARGLEDSVPGDPIVSMCISDERKLIRITDEILRECRVDFGGWIAGDKD